MKKRRKTGFLVLVFLLAMVVLGGTALAATTTVIITGGGLVGGEPTVEDFATVTLNGTAQTTTAGMGTFTVTDSRGTGAGWNVTVQAGQFTGTGHTLPLSSISMPQPSVAVVDSTSGGLPSLTAGSYPIDVVGGVKIASAAADGTGMGSYMFTPGSLTLTVPASAYADTYTSTVTISVTSGP